MKICKRAVAYIFIAIMAVITIFPFFYMVSSSFMSYQEATGIPPTMLPSTWHWENFGEAMRQAPFARYFLNTIFVATVCTCGTLVTTTLAAFALGQLRFRFKKALTAGMIALLMVPYELVIFTNYWTIAQLGLLDTYWALVLPSMASVFYIFYLRDYLSSMPTSYYAAAKVIGCSDLEFIWRIMIPLNKSALFTMALLLFIGNWNGFLWPLMVTNSPEKRLISNGLSAFTSESGSYVQLQMAASTITILPILVLYAAYHKRIIAGVVGSGIKG